MSQQSLLGLSCVGVDVWIVAVRLYVLQREHRRAYVHVEPLSIIFNHIVAIVVKMHRTRRHGDIQMLLSKSW